MKAICCGSFDPITKGHEDIVRRAARLFDEVVVLVAHNAEKSYLFSKEERCLFCRKTFADLPNVTVLPTGPYLISSATFPTYFLKDRENAEAIHCLLDIEIFCKYYVPKFGITRRYVALVPHDQSV